MEYITKETAIKAIQGLCIEENTPQMIWSTDAMDAVRNAPDGWISVKDRLPDAAGYECLVCAVNENYNQTHVFTAHTGYGEPGWWTSNVHYMSRATSPSDNKLHPALKVTHWMPLPEPPKEEEQNA